MTIPSERKLGKEPAKGKLGKLEILELTFAPKRLINFGSVLGTVYTLIHFSKDINFTYTPSGIFLIPASVFLRCEEARSPGREAIDSRYGDHVLVP